MPVIRAGVCSSRSSVRQTSSRSAGCPEKSRLCRTSPPTRSSPSRNPRSEHPRLFASLRLCAEVFFCSSPCCRSLAVIRRSPRPRRRCRTIRRSPWTWQGSLRRLSRASGTSASRSPPAFNSSGRRSRARCATLRRSAAAARSLDCDNDGWQDILLVAAPHAAPLSQSRKRAFRGRTRTRWGFRRSSPETGRAARSATTTGTAVSDLVPTGYRRLALLKNEGGGHLRTIRREPGSTPHQSAALGQQRRLYGPEREAAAWTW